MKKPKPVKKLRLNKNKEACKEGGLGYGKGGGKGQGKGRQATKRSFKKKS